MSTAAEQRGSGNGAASPLPLGAARVAPSLRRRMASFLYEGVLLFGIVMMVGLLYGLFTNQRHALAGALGLQTTLFAVLGLYFVHFWCRSGQTLAMKTWHIRLLGPQGRPPGPARATVRYLLAWLWFMPALALVGFSGLRAPGAVSGVVAAGVLAYGLLARLRADRQFFHDVVCGTRLVDARQQPQREAAP